MKTRLRISISTFFVYFKIKKIVFTDFTFLCNCHFEVLFQPIRKLSAHFTNSQIYVLRCFVNSWMILGDVWKEVVFLKGLVKFGEIRNIEDLM